LNILFWALVIGLIVWLVSSLAAGRMTSRLSSGTTTPAEAPLDILKKRYARGEITKPEYDEMRRDLGA
jgi:putative membrane protein